MIAAKIKEQVSRGDILVSQNRPVCYRDYMILVQRRNSFVEEMVRECKNAGVNVSGVDKIRLLEQIAVQDLVALGQFLLLPTDDLTLAAVLKSPLFGLNDDDLFVLCYNRGGASVWTRLCDNPDYRRTYLQLRELLDMADYVRPFELYGYVLNKQGGRKKFVERMGLEVEDGLDEFVNLTLAYEQEHIPSLQGFVQWIAGRRGRNKARAGAKRGRCGADYDGSRFQRFAGTDSYSAGYGANGKCAERKRPVVG